MMLYNIDQDSWTCNHDYDADYDAFSHMVLYKCDYCYCIIIILEVDGTR